MSEGPPGGVDVVVATHGRASSLPRLQAALAAQVGVGAFRVVVVDDASADDTGAVLADLARRPGPDLDVVRLDTNVGPAGARNAGLARCDADWVAFIDDDCVPSPDWLSSLLATAERHGADVVAGRVRPDPGQARGPFSRTLEVEDARFLQTANVLYRRDRLVAVGGFDERLRTGEDTDLGQRVLATGARVAFAPDALVHHDVTPSSVRAAVRQATRWVDLPAVAARHPHLRRTHLVHRLFWKRSHPPTMVGLAATAVAVATRRRWPLLAWAWWVWHRLLPAPLAAKPRQRVATLPGALIVDLVEVVTMLRGSVRHRSPML